MASLMNGWASQDAAPDPEVAATAKRRQFSGAEKRRILNAADRCTQPGELGALLRREGIYSSMLATWRKQRAQAEATALQARKARAARRRSWQRCKSTDIVSDPFYFFLDRVSVSP